MRTLISIVLALFVVNAFGQREIQFFRYNDQRGVNVFESPKADTIPYEGLRVRVGGDFAFQFQGLDQSNDLDNLVELGTNFNLPTANLNIDAQLYDGMRVHIRTYLSALHHQEAWVKGGHIQIDKLDFIKEGFLSGLMEYATLTIGLDEFNYGDAHYRRTDNARAIFNPFVGNYIMDAFSTEAFVEGTLQFNGIIGVLGISNGKLNQSTVVNENTDNKISFYGKVGYDTGYDKDFRFRLTGSWYLNKGTSTGYWLYGGDRGGNRYYNVMHTLDGEGSDFEGRWNPRFRQMTAFQINPFVKFGGLEFFGIAEFILDGNDEEAGTNGGSYTQWAGELLYRFGKEEKFYVGGRYNTVNGSDVEDGPTRTINRFNVGGGWYLTKNVLFKAEYVNQKYKDEGFDGSRYQGGEFNGFMLEGAISF